MNTIDKIAEDENLSDSFIHQHAIKLFNFVKDNYEDHEYLGKLCYYLISNLDPTYMQENVYNLLPNYKKNLSRLENNNLRDDAILYSVKNMLNILKLCSGNLLYPNKDLELLIINELVFNDKDILGVGSYGKVYLIDGYAVKVADYQDLGMEFAFLVKETTALSILGRIKFIGINEKEKLYYIGMDYYPKKLVQNTILQIDNYEVAMNELAKELQLIHSFGIIHGDIKFDNIGIDKDGRFRIIDFGSCRFTLSPEGEFGFFGTMSYKDYLLLDNKEEIVGFETDIWSLGIIFYIMKTGHSPWEIFNDEKEQKNNIEKSWDSAMENVDDFIKGMLSLTKQNRWTLERIICVTEYNSYIKRLKT